MALSAARKSRRSLAACGRGEPASPGWLLTSSHLREAVDERGQTVSESRSEGDVGKHLDSLDVWNISSRASIRSMSTKRNELLYGTLDFLVLRTVRLEPLHGYGIKQRLYQVTQGALDVNGGSLFPALYRLERQGLLVARWRRTETGRRAKFYALTAAGRRRLEEETRVWERASNTIARVVAAT